VKYTRGKQKIKQSMRRNVYMCLVLEISGLILGFLGSVLLLIEPIKFRLKNEHVEVDADIAGYNKRLRIRRVGIVLLATGFALQIVAIV
jgi:hypothetical protein